MFKKLLTKFVNVSIYVKKFFSFGSKLIIFGPFPKPYGGVATYLDSLTKNLKDHNFIIWDTGDGSTKFSGCKYFNVSATFLSVFRTVCKSGFGRTLFDNSSFFMNDNNLKRRGIFWLFLMKFVFRYRWVKMVHSGGISKRYAQITKLEKYLFRLEVRLVDKLIVVSDDIRAWLVEEFEVNSSEVEVVGTLLPIPANDYPQKVKSYKRPGRSFKVISIGAVNKDYGFHHVLSSVSSLRQNTNQNIDVTLIAPGFAYEKSYGELLLGYGNWVEIFVDVSRKKTLDIISNSDLFVRSPRYEGFGLSKVEAIMLGVPVISTNLGQTVGVATYEYGDVKKLESLIKSAITNPEIFSTHVCSARRYYEGMALHNLQLTKNFLSYLADSSSYNHL